MGAHCNFYSQIKTLAFLQLVFHVWHCLILCYDFLYNGRVWQKTIFSQPFSNPNRRRESRKSKLEVGCWSGCQHGRLNIVLPVPTTHRPESNILYSFHWRQQQFYTFVEMKLDAQIFVLLKVKVKQTICIFGELSQCLSLSILEA